MTVLTCKICGKEYYRKPSYIKMHGSSYCSKPCQTKDSSRVLSGENNPNFKGGKNFICLFCGKIVKSYDKKRMYCSQECYHKSKETLDKKECKYCRKFFSPRTSKQIYCCTICSNLDHTKKIKSVREKIANSIEISCQNCGGLFSVTPSRIRKFCSYDCFLKNGGANRAGKAAVMARTKYGQRKDENHHEIFEAIRKITAAYDLSTASFGVPDGIAWIKNGWHLFDVKNPKTSYGRRGLNTVQKKWALKWNGGPVFLIHSIDEAISFAQGKFDGLKVFPENHMEAKEYGHLF